MATQLLRLTLLDGDVDGLRMAEIAGRTTKLVACPLSSLERLLRRQEARRTAVYFLYGQEFDKPSDAIYVGECDAVARRFGSKHHAMDRAEWRQIVAAFSSDAIFNKAHARRAEHLLAERVRSAAKATLLTEQSTRGELDEGDAAFADQFVDDVAMLAEALGFPAFRALAKPRSSNASPSQDSAGTAVPEHLFRFIGEAKLDARMRVSGDDFILLAGSVARAIETPGCADSIRALRLRAKAAGVLVAGDDENSLSISRDFAVGSTSAAGGFVAGRNSRGPNEWVHLGSGRTYAQWLADKQTTAANGASRSND